MRELLEALAVKLDERAKYQIMLDATERDYTCSDVYTEIATLIREVVADDRKVEEARNALMDEAYNDARGSEKDW